MCQVFERKPPKVILRSCLKDAFKGGNNEYFSQADERIALQKKRIERNKSTFRYSMF